MPLEETLTRVTDPYFRQHLRMWLDSNINGDDCRAEVAVAMVDLFVSDVEYWSSKSWTEVYDDANCVQIELPYMRGEK